MEPNQNPTTENPPVPSVAPETPTQPQNEPPQEPPTPVIKKRSVFKVIFVVVIIFFIFFILLSVSVYFYLQSQGLTPDKLSPQPVTPKITIEPRDEDTNTYQNQNYNFSLPVAKDLKTKESSYGFGVSSIELRAADTPAEYGADFQMLLFPNTLGKTIGQDFEKYYAMADNSTQEVKDPTGASQKFTKIRNRTINNSRAFEFNSNAIPQDPKVDAEIGVYIELGSDVLVVTTGESNKEELESMLADFKYPIK